MASSLAVRAIGGGAAVLLLVLGSYLLVRSQDDEPGASESPGLARNAEVTPAPLELPAATPVEPEPLAGSTDALEGAAAAASQPSPSAGPHTLADIGQPVEFSGRVVDEFGEPVAGAEVIHVASAAAVKALDRQPIPFGPRLPWDAFPRTRTGEDGRFVLATHELPRPEREVRPPVQDGAWVQPAETVPSLAVLHPGFEAALHTFRSFRDGDLDVGDIALTAGCLLSGILVDEVGTPVPGAKVSVSDLQPEPDASRWDQWVAVMELLTAGSGDDGRFTLGGLWPGTISLRIEAAGFVPLQKDFECRVSETTDAGQIILQRGGVIAGFVLDTQGAPVASAMVKARDSEIDMSRGATDTTAWEFSVKTRANDVDDVEALSNERGAFELLALDRERYTVLAGRDGYEPVKLADVPTGTRDVTLTLAPAAQVIVTVLDARTREPVPGVSATGRRLSGAGNRTGMDQSTKLQVLAGDEALAAAGEASRSTAGLLVARGLGPARNTLTVSAAGYATAEFELPASPPAGRLLHDVELLREASISGQVVDERGEGVAKASIEVVDSRPATLPLPWDKPRVETTDAEGRFLIGGLRASEWKLTAYASGFARAEPLAVTVAAEQSVEGLVLPLAIGARITGVVLAPDGTPLSGCAVQAQLTSVPSSALLVEVTAHGTSHRRDPSARPRNYPATSGEDGRFAIEELHAGPYDVTAGPGAQATVELEAGGHADLVLRQRRPPTIAGRVTDANGLVAGATVECLIQQESGGWSDAAEVTTTTTGEYLVQLSQAGTYLLLARVGGVRAPPRLLTADWDKPMLADLAFGGERLAGRVLAAASGEPLADASVRFTDETGLERDGLGSDLLHFYRSETKTSAQGRFETRRLQPGRYTIEVSKKGHARAVRREVDVPRPGSGPEAELEFELAAGATVTGTVRAAGGGALEGELSVRLRPEAGADASISEKRMTVPSDGRFVRRDLSAGSCVVQALRFVEGLPVGADPWMVVAERSCLLAAGETTTVDLVITP